MAPSELIFLGEGDVTALALTDAEILAAVEYGLRAQGTGAARLEPRVHLEPDSAARGHFNILRGYLAPDALVGVKVIGDYLDNYTRGLPSELGLLTLFDAHTDSPSRSSGPPRSRRCAPGAHRARCAASRPEGARVLGHIGARGTAYWNVRLLDSLFDFAEIRVHSRRPESRTAFARRLEVELEAGPRNRQLGGVPPRGGRDGRGVPARATGAAPLDCVGRPWLAWWFHTGR
jgi:ornithine cyclodeaminase